MSFLHSKSGAAHAFTVDAVTRTPGTAPRGRSTRWDPSSPGQPAARDLRP